MSSVQLDLSFDAGLLEEFPEFRDLCRAAVYSCGRPFKIVASDLDIQPSLLSRMLSETTDEQFPRHFPLFKLPDLIRATNDLRLVYWLVEAFLEDPSAKHKRVIEDLADMLPRIQQKLAQLNGSTHKARRK